MLRPFVVTFLYPEAVIDRKLVVAGRKLKVDSVRRILQILAFFGAATEKMPFSCLLRNLFAYSTNF